MHWAGLVGSLFAIGLVVLAVRWLGHRDARLQDADEAERLSREMLPGFAPAEAVLCGEGRAALLIGRDGDFAVLKRLGSHFAARHLTPPLTARRKGERGLEVESGDRWFGRIELLLPDPGTAEQWRRRIVEAGRP